MQLKELKKYLLELNIPITFSHWEQGQVPTLPYIVISKGPTSSMMADNRPIIKEIEVTLDLYQENGRYSLELESELTKKLVSKNLVPLIGPTNFLNTELMYQTEFTIYLLEKEAYNV